MTAPIDPEVIKKARALFQNPPNPGHALRPSQSAQVIEEELRASLDSGIRGAEAVLSRIRHRDAVRVLDIGSSWGSSSIGYAASQRVISVIGVDPDSSSLSLAARLLRSGEMLLPPVASKLSFVNSPAEHLPFADGSFDLIVCHTVIEHVRDVEKSILEMYRVLAPGGMVDLEAPNYLWPHEPHLDMLMFPLGPKWFLKLHCRLRSGKNPASVDDLRFVNPFWLEAIFRRHKITYNNLYLSKIRSILLDQDLARVVWFKKLLPVVKALNKFGLAGAALKAAALSGFYPSMHYELTKPDGRGAECPA
jgi:ubiquinone/menaquinone biosynthesis C-methylase UbiE